MMIHHAINDLTGVIRREFEVNLERSRIYLMVDIIDAILLVLEWNQQRPVASTHPRLIADFDAMDILPYFEWELSEISRMKFTGMSVDDQITMIVMMFENRGIVEYQDDHEQSIPRHGYFDLRQTQYRHLFPADHLVTCDLSRDTVIQRLSHLGVLGDINSYQTSSLADVSYMTFDTCEDAMIVALALS